MKSLLIITAALLLASCASLQGAGSARYSIKPMLLDGKAVCCEVAISNGKEYASLDAMVMRQGDTYTVQLSERGVQAFRGQEIAAGAGKQLASSAAKAGAAAALVPVLPGLAPAIGAALASPGIGAAAVGAGALAVGQGLAK